MKKKTNKNKQTKKAGKQTKTNKQKKQVYFKIQHPVIRLL